MFWLQVRRRETRRVAAALRSLLELAQLDRGCGRCGLMTMVGEPGQFLYFEEWASEEELRRQIRSDRCRQMLVLMESAAAPPVLEIRTIGDVRGFEYVKALRSEQG
jgi:quinol monooxygenase YgiN